MQKQPFQVLKASRDNEEAGHILSRKETCPLPPPGHYYDVNGAEIPFPAEDNWWPFIKDACLFVTINLLIAIFLIAFIPDVNLVLFL